MTGVTLSKVAKSFGHVDVIRDIDLEIPDRAFAVLVGPSGCGKSTMLKLIAGLEELSRGEIRIGTRLVNDLSPGERDVAMVFQSYALYPHMTVLENLSFHLRIIRMARAQREAKAGTAAASLGIAQLLARYPRELSGGQRQRVAMGRAIVREPKAFLFDEPLSNLDAQLRIQMRAEIKSLQQRLKTTTIYVTHDQVEAMTLADLIVVMRDGRIEQMGAPLEVYDNPANAFVGGFIGSPPMNLVEGTLRQAGSGAVVETGGVRLPVGRATPAGWEGRRVIYGVRPGAFQPAATEGAIHARVDVIEPTGDELFAHVLADGVKLHVGFSGRPPLKVGDAIALTPVPERVHLFDAESGRRLANH